MENVKNKRFSNSLLIPFSILFIYIILETITYSFICLDIWRPDFFSVCDENFGVCDKPYTRFDSISGYKYIGPSPHFTSIIGDSIQYDHVISVNNMGYSSIYDYSYKKKPGIKRWIVFGDSYSAGEITDTTWVDLLQGRLSQDSVELYNFSLEASGISVWHNIFFKEVIPHYEFDGVVLAVVGDLSQCSYDLVRPYVIKHSHKDYTGIGFFPQLPHSTEEFENNYKNSLVYTSSIYDSPSIDRYKHKLLHIGPKPPFRLVPLRPYFTEYVIQVSSVFFNLRSMKKHYPNDELDHKILKGDYAQEINYDKFFGEANTEKVKAILDYCQKNGKDMYIISIPSSNIVSLDPLFYHNNLYNRHLKLLSTQYHANYFDGYELFDSIPTSHRYEYTLYNDQHWNRKAMNLFVRILYPKTHSLWRQSHQSAD